ncbi:MFS general substrate transporter [Aureobasidium pullulans]|uniref:Cercosporin MFS transporter CTB4 n=1 Tax=Aureobasidium pullulans TaxID=5580 RepID=A0A4S9M2A4_AURPU|nr:MFS general substrate transporter [Aureobasidium pullulans]
MVEQKDPNVYAGSKSSSDLERATTGHLDTDIEKQHGNPLQSTNTTDPNIVDWDGPEDPRNPMNWTGKAKIISCSTIIFLTLLTPLASSMFAPGVPDVLREFHETSVTLAAFVVSVYLLGFAVGPLLISPLSEIYGRRPVYVVCNVGFIVFTVACAVASSMSQLIVFRFLAGCFGVAPVTLGGASIADMIAQEKRGAAMSFYAVGPLLGPVIGPVAGAYLATAEGWRWVFWLITIAYGVATIIHVIICKETYAPALLRSKTKRLQKETNNADLRSKLDDGLSDRERMSRALVRPFKMLCFSPIVFLTSFYVAVVYGILYLLFTTFTFVFEEHYHFSSSNVGLSYIASGIGMFFGLVLTGASSDRILKLLSARNNGEMKPEFRLPPLIFLGITMPIAQKHVQWSVPMLGTLFFGIGVISCLICIQTYLIDAFTMHAASAMAANTLLRSILGGLLPLAGLDMYDALGLRWGNSLLGFVALALLPIPVVFYWYGERIRSRFPVKL